MAQDLLLAAAWVAAGALAGYALWAAVRWRTSAPIAILLAPAIGALYEPMWDRGYHVFLQAPAHWTSYSSFGIPHASFVVAIHPIIYSTGAFVIGAAISRGASHLYLYKAFLVSSILVGALSVAAVACGPHRYYGGRPFELPGHYPLWCAVLEGGHIVVFAVLGHRLVAVCGGKLALLLLPILAVALATISFGVVLPLLTALETEAPAALGEAAVFGAVCAVVATVWVVGLLLRRPAPSANESTTLRVWARSDLQRAGWRIVAALPRPRPESSSP